MVIDHKTKEGVRACTTFINAADVPRLASALGLGLVYVLAVLFAAERFKVVTGTLGCDACTALSDGAGVLMSRPARRGGQFGKIILISVYTRFDPVIGSCTPGIPFTDHTVVPTYSHQHLGNQLSMTGMCVLSADSNDLCCYT